MTNPDRGAYTPPTEPPLSFDARKPVRGRGPAPMMLIVSGLVLLILLGAIAVFYKSGQSQGSGPPPVVGSPIGQLKTAPPSSQQPTDPAQGLQIYNQTDGQEQTTAPKFTPPPEQPKARATLSPLSQAAGLPGPGTATQPPASAQMPTKPFAALPINSPAPALKPAVTATAPAVKIVPVAPAPKIVVAPPEPKPLPTKLVPPVAIKTPPPPTAKPTPAIVKSVVPALAAKTPSPKAVAAKPSASPPAVSSGSASVQIGAFSSQALADKEWSAAAKSTSGKGKRVEAVPKNGGTLYRTTVTGFGSRADATAFCDKLKAAGKACFVK